MGKKGTKTSVETIPTDRPVRVGVVGIGGAAQVTHLPILSMMEDVELVALSDIEEYKLSRLSEKYGVPGFVDCQNMLRNVKPDVALICTPTISHLPLSLSALRAGAHVIVEKPATRNLAETERLAEAARDNNRMVLVGMNLRFRQDVSVLSNFLNSGELGKIWRVKAGWLKRSETWARSPWLDQLKISGGGVMMDLGIQILDMVHWLLGKPKLKRLLGSAHSSGLKREVEDTVSVFLEYEDGMTLHIDCSWGLMTERSVAYSYFEGTEGAAQLNPLLVHKSMQGERVNVSPVKSLDPWELFQQSYKTQMSYFVYSLRGETKPISTIDEAVETMRLIDMIYRSISEGREILPDDV